jgi:peptidoglycan/LPS O-acetylase OafA/YrhL
LPARDSGAARWVYLDVLRAVAILLVLGPHTPFRLPEESGGRILFEAWRHIGWVGVDLFFVLSGFLIGGLLFAEQRKHGAIRFGRFFIRRTFKIWPSYLVFLAAAFAWDVRAGSGSFTSRLRDSAHAIWPYLIHVQNYYSPLVERIGHAWSLAVEEHFYVLLPLLLFLMGRWAAKRSAAPFHGLPWICLLLAMTCLGLRFYFWQGEEQFDEFKNHWPTHLQIDSLFFGVTLAYGVHFARPRIEALRRWCWLILIASVACFAPFTWVFGKSTFACTIGYTLLAVGSMGLVLVAWFASVPPVDRKPLPSGPPGIVRRAGNLVVNLLAMIGARSYSIYLWHMPFTVPVVLKLQTHLGFWESRWHYAMMMAIYTVVAVGFGSIMYALIEAPGVMLRDRWFPSKPRKDAPCYPINFEPPRALGTADDLRPI